MIVRMKKIRLYAVRSQKEDLLSDLMRLGCVELSEPASLLNDPELLSMLKNETSDLEIYRSEHQSLIQALELLDQYAPKKGALFSPRPEYTEKALLDGADTPYRLEIARQIVMRDSQNKRLTAEENRIRSQIETLTPWAPLDLPLDFEGTRYTACLIGAVPESTDLNKLEGALAESVPESQLFHVSSTREQHFLMLICLKDRLGDASDALRPFNFSVSALKNLHGTAGQHIAELNRRLAELSEEKATNRSEIEGVAAYRQELKLCADHIGTKIAKAEAAERLMGTESTIALMGWFPAHLENRLNSVLEKYDCAWETSDPLPEETADVPICVKNNALTAPLGMVTSMYSPPAYDGIDANPLIAPFFCLFFGIMYADLGYGLVLTTLCTLFKLKAKPRGGTKKLVELMILCGISAMVIGFLTGGFFGNAIASVAGIFGIDTPVLPSFLNMLTHPLLDPSKDMILILVISLGLGFIQVVTGMAINAYMLIRDGHFWDALMDVGSWWLLFAGIAVGALGGTWYICYAGVAALILTQGRAKKGILGKFFGGLASLYNITSYMSDILSYSRLMALMLAGSVIANIVNMLGTMPGSIIVFIPIFLFGHAFNMAINIVGTYVHASRLQYLEYFGKFYKDGGREFNPLRISTSYVDII